MVRLGLKLLYLRTRVRKLSQQQLAMALEVRQATLSHIERGRALPGIPLLLQLARYFDVSPSWLVDEESGLDPDPSNRWSARGELLTIGMSIEVDREHVQELPNGKLLVTLAEDAPFYDEEAAALRRAAASEAEALEQLGELHVQRDRDQCHKLGQLEAELDIHPRRRARVRRDGA